MSFIIPRAVCAAAQLAHAVRRGTNGRILYTPADTRCCACGGPPHTLPWRTFGRAPPAAFCLQACPLRVAKLAIKEFTELDSTNVRAKSPPPPVVPRALTSLLTFQSVG